MHDTITICTIRLRSHTSKEIDPMPYIDDVSYRLEVSLFLQLSVFNLIAISRHPCEQGVTKTVAVLQPWSSPHKHTHCLCNIHCIFHPDKQTEQYLSQRRKSKTHCIKRNEGIVTTNPKRNKTNESILYLCYQQLDHQTLYPQTTLAFDPRHDMLF